MRRSRMTAPSKARPFGTPPCQLRRAQCWALRRFATGTLTRYAHAPMDALERDKIKRSRETPPAEKLRQALECADAGLRLQRAKLRARYPEAFDQEIEQRFFAWLCRE